MPEENTTTSTVEPVRLNLGAGGCPINGYVNLDLKDNHDIRALPYAKESVDEIRASHVLEHIANQEVFSTVKHWFETLKPGGLVKIAVPDFDWIVAEWVKGDQKYPLEQYIMGGQTDQNDFHGAIFTFHKMEAILRAAGFVDITTFVSDANDCSSLPVSLNVQASKPTHTGPLGDKVVCCMSIPRLLHSDNVTCTLRLLAELGIHTVSANGAYWSQCLERCMSEVIAAKPEVKYILTADYDSIFTSDQVRALFNLAERTNFDAYVPLQVKRESAGPMFSVQGEDGKPRPITREEASKDCLPINSGHFGLTLIRVDALKRIPHPWFIGKPARDGTWGEGDRDEKGNLIPGTGRMDDDMYFWHNWKERGNTAALACRIKIGHLQRVVTWPDQNWQGRHQYVNDWTKDGIPTYAR